MSLSESRSRDTSFQVLVSLFFVIRGSLTRTLERLSWHEADGLEHLFEEFVQLPLQWLRLFCRTDVDLVRCPAEEDKELNKAYL